MKLYKDLVIVTQSAQHLFPAGRRTISGLDEQPAIVFPTANKEGSHRFPDGETYLRIPGLKRAERVAIVHSGYPDPNGGLMELFMTLDIIRHYAARFPAHLHAVFLSMPYARQDKAYYEGELNMADNLIGKLLKSGVHHVSALDAHFADERWVGARPGFTNVPVGPTLIEKARSENPGMLFMTPDAGAKRRAHVKTVGGATKKRSNSFDVSVSLDERFAGAIKGKTVGVVDDILSTGSTLVKFADQARKLGAKKVIALITHGVGTAGIGRIQKEFDGLYLADTINRAEANVSIRQLLDETCIARSFRKR